MHTATYVLTARDDATARALAVSLDVEARDPLPRASVRVDPAEGATFRIHVEAEDLATLRAASNSFLKWAMAADGALAASQVED